MRRFWGTLMGVFRCLLAIAVVLYHTGGLAPFGIHIGVAAVVSFYIVSGYAMTGLIERHFSGASKIVPFYCERLWRLAPQYLTYLALAMIVAFGFGVRSSTFQYGPFTVVDLLAHLTVVPLSLFMYSTDITGFMLIPPAWSLGTEMLFYLLFPFLLWSRWAVYAGIGCSMMVFLLAIAGVLPPDAFGYRLLPGVLFFFLIGHLIFRRDWSTLCMVALAMAIGGLVIFEWVGFDRGYNRSLYAGAVIGMIGVLLTRQMSKQWLDDLFGAASYGCYLGHMTLLLTFRHYGLLGDRPVALLAAVALLSMVMGLTTYWLVERPTVARRRSFRAAPDTEEQDAELALAVRLTS
jgi:peptidoglycan/LPS O-acetylase OafA/YrhL